MHKTSTQEISIGILISLTLLSPLSMARQDALDPSIRNESPLKYSNADSPNKVDVVGATFCSGGTEELIDQLEKIGISKDQLVQEIHCTVGDFDGNGYMDFAIWGNSSKNIGKPDYKNYLVLFFEKDQLMYSKKITSKHEGSLLVYYAPRSQIGVNGEPVTPYDALWEIGETFGYDDLSKGQVYIFDPKSKEFNRTQFGNK